MFVTTVIIALVLTVALMILNIILSKVSSQDRYIIYMPGVVLFATGLLLFMIATMAGKIEITGLGLGGWGIACLFASAIQFTVTSIVDTSTHS
ncbi:hypothetical protein [Virgibacillus salinus]|uniref:YesK-like protein n=1 Tax=Virgibacillus salinus TaxID=553311 RepID=A0A1H0Z3F4_9BACI|nr:hypothetical protein [Virgibacillus salinus]SDQ21969.1 hypothetical protein SAMN05216231_1004 [Virgibacillus salinus]